MIKQLALLVLLVAGIAGTVMVIQKSTLLRSFGYDVIDFSYFFHSKEGESIFNPNLDIYKDGTINTLDVIKDRYEQDATRSGTQNAGGPGDLSNILDSSQSAEASQSAD